MSAPGSLATAGSLLLLTAQSVPAAGAWYLLEPPMMIKQDTNVDVAGPQLFSSDMDLRLSQWHRKGAFDSAKECTAVREKRISEEQVVFERSQKWGDVRCKKFSKISLGLLEAAACIASDDRRLTQ